MGFPLFMEIFGYVGTALVVVSMLMTSLVKLRIFNIAGSVISLLYAIWGGAFPIVVMNGALILINVYRLAHIQRKKPLFTDLAVTAENPLLLHILSCYEEDIRRYFPDYTVSDMAYTEMYLVMCDGEPAGILAGHRTDTVFSVGLDYATPRYRDLSVAKFIYGRLKESGIQTLVATENRDYLRRAGFTGEGPMQKNL